MLVVGAGMTGLTAAAYAARSGLSVVVIEKAAESGGTAALSSGYIWTAPTLEALQGEDPACDAELGAALANHFPEGLEWISSLGIELGDRITGIYGFGYGYQIDIAAYLDRCREMLADSGGGLFTGVHGLGLTQDDGRVTGAFAHDVTITAGWTVLATGGLQGDPERRRRALGEEADQLVLRASASSTGDGLELGRSAGALTTGGAGFYGHLIARPLTAFEPENYLNFAQLHSGHCLLVNTAGERFTDETLGDHINNQETLRQPGARGVLIGDERTRREHVLSAYIPGMVVLDKLEFAGAAGAHYATAPTVAELAAQIGAWGYDAGAVERSVSNAGTLEEPPMFAIEVQPTITFAYAGLATNADAEVLGERGPIPGLLAGGADVGGVYKRGYAGSLARGLVFGIRAALTAAGAPGWRG
jgi:succinate dehydrogenase/fumarate reductase flavoprotein subunit